MVLMLSAAKTIVRDAARAVKRVSGLTIQEVTAESLTELLDLPGMKVTHFATETQDTERYLHLFCQHQHGVAIWGLSRFPTFVSGDSVTVWKRQTSPLCLNPAFETTHLILQRWFEFFQQI